MTFLNTNPLSFFTYIDDYYLSNSQILSLYLLINKHQDYNINIFTSNNNLEKNYFKMFNLLNIKTNIINLDNYIELRIDINIKDKIELSKIKYINQNNGIWFSLNHLWLKNIDFTLSNTNFLFQEVFKIILDNKNLFRLKEIQQLNTYKLFKEKIKLNENQNEYFIINRHKLYSLKKDNINNQNINKVLFNTDIKIIEDFILIGNNKSKVFYLIEPAYRNDILKYKKIKVNTFQNIVLDYYFYKVTQEKTIYNNFIRVESFNTFHQDLSNLLQYQDSNFNNEINLLNNISCIYWVYLDNKLYIIIEKSLHHYLKSNNYLNYPIKNNFWTISFF